jgi:hypothetical protein
MIETLAVEQTSRRYWLRLAGLAFGALCLVAAVMIAAREGDQLEATFVALRNPPPTLAILVIGSVAIGVLLTATLFQILTRRFAVIPFSEMFALIAASALANYLPLKPGLLGRVAYHRVRHGIRATDTVRTIFEAIALSGLVASVFLLAVLALRRLALPPEWALLAPGLLGCLGISPRLRVFVLVLVVRQAEFALIAFRYWAVFQLIGAPVEVEAAIVLASVNAIATLLPFVSNGLGIREWLTGVMTPLLSADTFSQGVVAELVHRVVELIVLAPLGLASIAVLVRKTRQTPAKK